MDEKTIIMNVNTVTMDEKDGRVIRFNKEWSDNYMNKKWDITFASNVQEPVINYKSHIVKIYIAKNNLSIDKFPTNTDIIQFLTSKETRRELVLKSILRDDFHREFIKSLAYAQDYETFNYAFYTLFCILNKYLINRQHMIVLEFLSKNEKYYTKGKGYLRYECLYYSLEMDGYDDYALKHKLVTFCSSINDAKIKLVLHIDGQEDKHNRKEINFENNKIHKKLEQDLLKIGCVNFPYEWEKTIYDYRNAFCLTIIEPLKLLFDQHFVKNTDDVIEKN